METNSPEGHPSSDNRTRSLHHHQQEGESSKKPAADSSTPPALQVQVPLNKWPSIEQIGHVTVPASDPNQQEGEDRRRDELRKAGADYLTKALAQATKGADPFQVDPNRVQKERRQRKIREDPEFVAFGALLKDGLVYVYIGLYLLCTASSYLLVKLSFHHMQTPAVLTFLHMLAASGALSLLCHYDMLETLQLSVPALKGSSVRIILYASQMLCTFSALHHNSVNVVLVWTTAGGAAIEAVVGAALGSGAPLTRQAGVALLFGFGAGVLELFFDDDKVAVGLIMLTLWSISKTAECVWRQLKVDATLGGRLSDAWLLSRIRAVADEEAQLGSSSLSCMQNLVPAVPVLLLGFIGMEGEELVSHELSVPGLKVMLLACLAYAVATVCQLLLNERLTHPSSKLALRGVSLVAAIVLFAMEEYRTISFLAVLLTLASVASSMLAMWRQHEAFATSLNPSGYSGVSKA